MKRGVSGGRYWNSNQSSLPKKGEPSSHSLACRLVKAWYRPHIRGCIVERDWPVYFSKQFMQINKLDYGYHEADLAFFEYVDGPKNESFSKIHTVVEVDGERHQSKLVKINDGVFGRYIEETYPWVKFVRLNKLDCIHGDVKEREEYFKKMFFG